MDFTNGVPRTTKTVTVIPDVTSNGGELSLDPVVSQDFQWGGVVADPQSVKLGSSTPEEIRVIRVDPNPSAGFGDATTTTAAVRVGGNVTFRLVPGVAPISPVVVPLQVPAGFALLTPGALLPDVAVFEGPEGCEVMLQAEPGSAAKGLQVRFCTHTQPLQH